MILMVSTIEPDALSVDGLDIVDGVDTVGCADGADDINSVDGFDCVDCVNYNINYDADDFV